MNKYNKLTREEEHVLLRKGTEPPFSGKYNDFYEDGFYSCKQCNAPLYSSVDKFSSACGWPSFDDALTDSIQQQKDMDGVRTEIVCAKCGGHLGHIFTGEGITKKNTRHCVNSISLLFKARKPYVAKAYFAGGCFWGIEHLFQQMEGVISAVSGYMGGSKQNPSYEEVSQGNSGHLEVVEVTYGPVNISYEDLVKFFFEIHDPTQANGQGPDIGEQYLSVAFYGNDKEQNDICNSINILKEKGYNVITAVRPVSTFWKAEEYHQDYYDKKKTQPYCHRYEKKF
ncbi:MAG: bifunctional methionine sulfoxide reductase B/A protein [Candidatus Electrothrix sp. AR3]|nr:bifunctional methionine sulfoxide reductase B/A protein [Candidatus Electrothrix sp. AR3]